MLILLDAILHHHLLIFHTRLVLALSADGSRRRLQHRHNQPTCPFLDPPVGLVCILGTMCRLEMSYLLETSTPAQPVSFGCSRSIRRRI